MSSPVPSDTEERNWPHYTEAESIEVMGLSTAYRRQGSGEKAVYLHGAGLTRRWLPLYENLSSELDLTVPEHPGFGDTDLPTNDLTFEDLVIHYDEFFNLMENDRIHLIGHSLGAWIAAEYAVFHPERIASLTLICPIGLRVGTPIFDVFRMTPDEVPDRLFNGNVEPVADFLPDPESVDARIHAYWESTTFAHLAWNPRYDRRLDHRLQRVTMPSTVITPDEDRLVPPEQAARWLELLPDAEAARVSGAEHPTGHLMIVQEPDALAKEILDGVERGEA